ncbi:MAG: T9SS type A sorting domain-containing protein [Bacteroidetes bacterium]|nr:T9SS type A sorting domain-containing protein [Bacteroidota bacterium]
MRIKIFSILFFILFSVQGICQYPWNNPLKIAWSSDGINFSTPSVFQDSAGVPSVIRWKGDTLIAAFQWFRLPNPSPSWDRVATKLSFDNGISWTQPGPINLIGLPVNFQRPFDPTLCVFNNDSLRIYFSSSNGMPGSYDSIIDTYSAKSTDGVNFYFEPSARVNEPNNRVIDPAVIFFNNSWHYLSPVGAPQQGAYHYISPDGLNFTKVPDIASDNTHNWTGNYMIESSSELRFYGSGQYIWYNSSPNGGIWNNYINTTIQGGDPSVLKTANNNYLMIYVGQPYSIGINDNEKEIPFAVYPNPCANKINVIVDKKYTGLSCEIISINGKILISKYINSESMVLDLNHLPAGIYLLRIGENFKKLFKIIKN